MDINLPGICELEALKILASNPAMAHIPVLTLSANAMPCDIKKGLEAGFFRYLTCPNTRGLVLQLVQQENSDACPT